MKISIITVVLLSIISSCSSKILFFDNFYPKYPFSLKDIFDSLFLSNIICIWSAKGQVNQRTQHVQTQIYTFHNYTVSHRVYGHGEPLLNVTQCLDNVVFNFDFFYHRVLFQDNKPTERHVFLVIDTLGTNIEGMKKVDVKMFKILWTAKMVLLTEYQVYKFSSPYFPPRRLETIDSLEDLKDKRVTDLGGRTVNIGTFNCSLFSILKGPMNSGLHDGIEMRIMQQLAVYLNMTPNYILAGGWGAMFDNGTWSGGLAAMLVDGKAEIGFCNIWNTIRYNQVVALGPQWNQIYLTFILPRPVMFHGYWVTIVTLFHWPVWILLLLICFVVTILFWKFKKSQKTNILSDLIESMLTVFGSFIGQTSYLPPCHVFSKRVIVSWSIFSFFMASVLNNMMISRLMVPHQSEKVDTVKDFVRGGYHWGEEVFSNFQMEAYFNQEDPWHNRMANQFQAVPRSCNMLSTLLARNMGFAIQQLGHEYAFIVQKNIDQSLIDSFRPMKEHLNQFGVSLVFSKMSPMLEICKYPLLRFMETGLVIHWKNEVILNYGLPKVARLLVDPPGESLSEFEPLTIDNNLAAFQILLYGWFLSTVVFVVELFLNQKLRVEKVQTKSQERDEVPSPYFYCE